MIESILKFILLVLFALLVIALSFLVPVEASDNDDLAFEFADTDRQVFIKLNECEEKGYYTKEIADRIKLNELIYEFYYSDYDNLEDFCQNIHEVLYRNKRDNNRFIRNQVN